MNGFECSVVLIEGFNNACGCSLKHRPLENDECMQIYTCIKSALLIISIGSSNDGVVDFRFVFGR